MGGWLETDNWAISVQLNLTGTATGTELGKNVYISVPLYDNNKILLSDSYN